MTSPAPSADAPLTSQAIRRATEQSVRHRRRRDWAMSPMERLAVSAALRRAAEQAMQANPKARDAFIRRNHHQRRLSKVKRLEAMLLKTDASQP